MINDEKEISCFSTHLMLKYARKKKLCHFADNIDIPIHILDNPHEWTYASTWTQLAANIEKELGGTPGILYTITQDIFLQETSIFFPLLLRILSLNMLFSLSKYAQSYSNKNIVTSVVSVGKNMWYYKVSRTKPGHFSRQMCEFNKGVATAYLKLKGYTNISITELTCIPRTGDKECMYKVEGIPPKSLFERLKSAFYFASRDRNAIISHLEENHEQLQRQYLQILTMQNFQSLIMRSMNESIVWLDADGIITFANKAFSTLTGQNESGINGNRFEKYLFDNFHSANFKLTCSDAHMHPLTSYEIELIFTNTKGDTRFGQTTIIWIPGEQQNPGYLLTIHDITEKRSIERQLSAAEDRYRSLYENSPALIVAVDMQGMFLYANPAMSEQSGYTETELLSMHFRELIAPDADFDVDHLIKNLLEFPTRLQEVHFKTKAGAWKCIALNTYHIKDSNRKLAGIAGIGIDLTETKRLNEQLIKTQRMDLLGQLAGGLAHDFGNILTSINGFSKLIATKSSEEKIIRYASSIERSGLRAYDLVKNLLAFSRSDETPFEIFDAVAIVAEVADMLTGAVHPDITIFTDVSDTPHFIYGSAGKVHQCILNLGINARDAIGKNKGTITFRLKKSATRILIEVEDTGSGISPDIIEKIFDPFFSTKAKKAGTGLGLSVVYGIMKSHEGDITVQSRPGEGSIFMLDFPLHLQETV